MNPLEGPTAEARQSIRQQGPARRRLFRRSDPPDQAKVIFDDAFNHRPEDSEPPTGAVDARPDPVHRRCSRPPLPLRDRLEGGGDAAPDRARPAAGLPRHRHRQPASPLRRGRGRPGRRGRDRERPGARGTTCSSRRSSPSGPGRTTACLTTPRPRSPPRSSSRSPARSSTWARTSSIPTCCTARASGPAWPRPTGRRGGRWRRSTRAAGPACSASATSPSSSSTTSASRRASGPGSSRTVATPSGAGTATSGSSAPRTGSSTRASRS